jgi:hypothetical protein
VQENRAQLNSLGPGPEHKQDSDHLRLVYLLRSASW